MSPEGMQPRGRSEAARLRAVEHKMQMEQGIHGPQVELDAVKSEIKDLEAKRTVESALAKQLQDSRGIEKANEAEQRLLEEIVKLEVRRRELETLIESRRRSFN